MGIIINDDFEVYHKYLWQNGLSEKADESTARSYIRRYANTQVRAIYFNVNAQFSYSPSSVIDTPESRYHRKEVDGVPFNFPGTHHKGWYDQVIVKGIDLWKVFTEEARAVGISPWLSIRPNDTHDNILPGGGLRQCDYTYNARKNGLSRCRHRPVTGYFDNCLDFSVPDVRERFLSYVKEQLLRYNVDGIEIDFMREAFLFRPGYEDEGREIIFHVMRSVRDIANDAAEKFSHPVSVAIRTFRDPEFDFYSGIDTPRLASEGLIDAVTVTGRWRTTDSDIPLEHWKNLLPKNVRLSLGTEMLCRSYKREEKLAPESFLRAMANYAYSVGTEDIYLYNYSYLAAPTADGLPERPEEQSYRDLLHQLGSLDTLCGLPRRHILTYNDTPPTGFQPRTTLPIPVDFCTEHSTVRVFTGACDEKMYLLLEINADPDEISVWLNSANVTYIGKTQIEKEYAEGDVLVYEATTLRPITQMLEVSMKEKKRSSTLSYVEIRNLRPEVH